MMRRRLIGASLLAAIIFGLPLLDAYGQNKKKAEPAKAKVNEVIDSSKLAPGQFVGVIKSVPGADRMFKLEIEVPATPNVGGAGGVGKIAGIGGVGGNWNQNNNYQTRLAQAQLRMQQAQAQMGRARTPQERQNAQRQLADAQRQIADVQRQMTLNAARDAAKVNQAAAKAAGGGNGGGNGGPKMAKKEIEFQASEKIKVRTMLLPDAFDEKGNPKTYSKEEKDALKGKDKTAPGYESSLEKLEYGQKVRVQLANAAVAAAPKAKDKDADDVAIDKKRQVSLIVILEEGTGGPMPKGKAKKKEK